MSIEFLYPKFKHGYNPSGVYKMTFDTGHFYFGSSKKLKRRIGIWVNKLKRKAYASKIIDEVFSRVKTVTIEIIKYCNCEEMLQIETNYISNNLSNPLLLNLAPTGFGNSGSRMPERFLKTKRIPKPQSPPKPVNKYTTDGVFVATYPSIGRAAASIGVKQKKVGEHLTYQKKRGICGFVFRLVGDERPIVVMTKKIKPPPLRNVINCVKPVIDLNTGIFWTAEEVAMLLGTKTRYIHRMLAEERKPNTSQYRYA